MSITKTMDSVFSNCTDQELEFDVMFDQEDSIIDTVNGVNESGDPLTGTEFEELHQTDDDATPKDIEDELEGDEYKNGTPNPEGAKDPEVVDNSVKGEVGKKSDADKFETDDVENNYQNNDFNDKVDEDNVTNNIDKAVKESDDIDDIDDELDPDDMQDEGCCKEECNDIDSELDPDDSQIEGCCKEGDGVPCDAEGTVNCPEEPAASNDGLASESSAPDADVKDIESDDDSDIDDVLDGDSDTNLDYDISDEELIDMVDRS